MITVQSGGILQKHTEGQAWIEGVREDISREVTSKLRPRKKIELCRRRGERGARQRESTPKA